MMKIYSNKEISAAFERLEKRFSAANDDIRKKVGDIIANIRSKGDEALFDYAKRFDGYELNENNIEVTKQEIEEALREVPKELLEIMKKSAANILEFHKKQLFGGYEINNNGAKTAQLVRPIKKAGVYVPGGKAAYPSTVLMNIIPAKVAGVNEIIVLTPCSKEGKVPAATLAAATIAGADRIFKMGGAHAVAAAAYGTKSVPRVNKIVGPGNAFVAEAKRQVFGKVGIDMVAGPTEILIIADETAPASYVAADILSQAEHDEAAACILVTTSEKLANEVLKEVEKQLENAERKAIAKASVEDFGTIIIASDIDEAVDIANEVAPEHLEIMIRNPYDIVNDLTAGAIFVGKYSPEPLGDYFAGTNHVLPTMGGAAFSSPLGVADFMTRTSLIDYSKEAFLKVADDVGGFAKAEGLYAHGKSALIRKEEQL